MAGHDSSASFRLETGPSSPPDVSLLRSTMVAVEVPSYALSALLDMAPADPAKVARVTGDKGTIRCADAPC